MNKGEFVKKVATKLDGEYTQAEAAKMVDACLETIKDAMIAGDKIQFVGFGSFEVAERAGRVGRNPQTGEPMHITAATVPKFKPGKAFKEAVNK